jgi:hypothetical protein
MAKCPQCPADEMCAQASFHADNAGRDLLESIGEGEPLDLLAQNDLPLAVKKD